MGTYKNTIGGKGVFLLILVTLFSVIGQYLVPQINNLFHGQVNWFSLRDSEMDSIGIWRYSKDVGYLLVAIYSSILLVISNSQVRQRWLWFVYAEIGFIALGTLGHVSNPGLLYWIAGMRWIITLHCVVSLAMLILLVEEEKGVIPTKAVDIAVAATLFFLLTVIVLQAFITETPLFSGRYRLYSLAPNAGALGYWIVGLGIYFFLGKAAFVQKIFFLIASLVIVNLSGSRGPEIAILIFISFELTAYYLRNKSDKDRKIGIAVWFLSLVIQLPLFSQVASYTAQRGGLLATQGVSTIVGGAEAESSFEENERLEGGDIAYASTRLENIRYFIEAMKNQPLSITMLGRGLGYGTNTAHLMQPKKTGLHTWVQPIDSAHAAFIAQFGLLGYASMGFIVFGLIKTASKRICKLEDRARLYVSVGIIFLLTLVQNVFENQLLVALCGIGVVLFISESAGNPSAIDNEARVLI